MKIQVLGSGCATCKKLYKTVIEVIKDLKIDAEVEYITDVTKMIEMGIMTSPAIVINNKIVFTGGNHDSNKIKEIINGHI